MINPVVQAAALQRIVYVARAVRGKNHNRWGGGFECSQFGNGYLEVGKNFQQVSLKLIVCTIDFVNQQHRRCVALVNGAKKCALNEKALVVQLAFQFISFLVCCFSACFSSTQMQQLSRVVPVVYGLSRINAFVTLQANEFATSHGCNHFGKFSFTNARFAFKQQRSLQGERQVHRSCEAFFGQVVLFGEGCSNLFYRSECCRCHAFRLGAKGL